ncbi:MAG: hypothetical protein ACJ79J_02530 [Gemmatimonadaceae bacterium]|jgi:hypothetical protein
MSNKHLYLVAAIAALGCASSPNPPDDSSRPLANSTRKTNFLAHEEIEAARADAGDAFTAIARLRANWLAPHGVAGQGAAGMEYARVYLDGQQYGDLNTLKNIQAFHVADITYFDVTQAGARFGINAGTGGVIDVRTKGSVTR